MLSPSTPMMIKKKTKDTMRKNVLRSPVIMMTHPLLRSGETLAPVDRIGAEHDGGILPRLRSLHRCHFIMNL